MEWTKAEKRALLQAMQEYGSVDMSNLTPVLPMRNVNEIKQFIRKYKLIAAEHLQKRTKKPELKLEEWRNYMKMKELPASKRQLREDLLSRVIKYIDYFEEGSNKNSDISACYEYIQSLLEGKSPKPVSLECKKFLFQQLKIMGNELKDCNVDVEEILKNANKTGEDNETPKTSTESELDAFCSATCLNPFEVPISMLKM